jgi:hypothetical protein
VTAPVLPAFATVEQYEAMTGQSPAPPNTQAMLDSASAAIRRYCGWHIAPVLTVDLILDGPGGNRLVLPTLHVVGILAITEKTGPSTAVAYDPADLDWSVNGVVAKRTCGPWTGRLGGVAAQFEHGWELAEVADLTQLVLSTVARSAMNPYGLASQAVGGVSIGMSPVAGGVSGGTALTAQEFGTVELYRLEPTP